MAGNPEHSPTLHASSARRKFGLSTTLPRNFAPLSLDPSDPPRTPSQTFAQLDLPPPPPHSTYRVRRPRLNMGAFQTRNNALPAMLFASELAPPSSARPLAATLAASSRSSSDEPVPSIETPGSPTRPPFFQTMSEPLSGSRLLLPSLSHHEPCTPPAQTTKVPGEIKRSEWDMQRAASVCSHRSDSSLSTNETFETRPTSFDGSATSPDCDGMDPFSPSQNVKIIPATPSRKSKKIRLHSFLSKDNVEWTIEMDNHLFNVYQIYLADPTVTPFKTVPGSIPPTGVCHRVSRRAKETWPRASRFEFPLIRRYRMRNLLDVRKPVREKTPEPEDFLKTGENTARTPWPSESATRKRLKQLCREKFTISAHYNRLRESRSPSPFTDQFLPRRPASRSSRSRSRQLEDNSPNTAYATRELGISLVASEATAPLVQLQEHESPLGQPASETAVSPAVASVGEAQPMPMDKNKLAPAASIPRLASPFSYSTWNGPVRQSNPHRRHISQNHFDTMHATGSRLLSPFRPEPDLSLNAHKRRAQHELQDELSPSGSSLAGHTSSLHLGETSPLFVPPVQPGQDLVFTGMGDINQRRIRLRNRGATLGSAHERIERLFAPPPALQEHNVLPVPSALDGQSKLGVEPAAPAASTGLMPPQLDPAQRRLGSPFELDPLKRSVRTKPARHLPSLSDPFIHFTHGVGPNPSTTSHEGSNMGTIGERLASFSQTLDEHRQHP